MKLNSFSLLLTKLRLTLSLPGAELEEDVEARTLMHRHDDWDPDSSVSVPSLQKRGKRGSNRNTYLSSV